MALDMKAIAQLRGIDEDGSLLQEIVSLYLRDSPPRLVEMADELQKGNVKRVAEIAHSLRSSSAYLGATQVQLLSSEIEDRILARQDDPSFVAPLLKKLNESFLAVATELRELLQTRIH